MLELQKAHVVQEATLKLSVACSADGPAQAIGWSVRNVSDQPFVGVARLTVRMPEHFDKPWIMVPGFFYGENRRVNQRTPKLYPRFDPAVREPANMTSSWWDFSADKAAAPLVYIHQDGHGFAVAAEPHYQLEEAARTEDDEPQIGVGFGHDGASGHIRFNVPACDEPFTYRNSPASQPTVRRLALPAGACASGRLWVYELAGDRHAYQAVLEDYYDRVGSVHEHASLPEIGPLAADAAHGIVAGHYHREGNYFIYSRPYDPVIEQIGNARGVSMSWHQMMTGFVNGLPVCRGLLHAAEICDDDEPRRVARLVADRICTEGVSPSGLFWADYTPRTVETPNGSFANPIFGDRNEWGSGWLPGGEHVHSRTIADACGSLAAMVEHERAHEASVDSLPLWERALLGNLQAVMDLQLPNGSFGQRYDAVKRTVSEVDGCGGLLWIPALIKAAELGIGGPSLAERMRQAAIRAGEAYAPYVEAEYIWGAPEDNDSPTSEDGQNAVMAYTELYRLMGDARHLGLARQAADWMLTFRKTYNVRPHPLSLMGRYGLKSKGGDLASVSNGILHVFEVLCTRHLCDLSRWTGSDYYRRRARDHWAFACQYLSRADGMYNGFRGAAAEQFYWADWGSWSGWTPPEYHRQKGNMAPFTAIWCIMVLLVAAPDAADEFYDQ